MCRRILISAANVPKGNRWHTEIIAIQGYFLCNYPCTEDWLRGTAKDIAVSIRGGWWVISSRPRQGERFLEPERKRPDRESWVANKRDPPLRDTVTPYHLVKNQKSKYLTSSSSPSYWLHPIRKPEARSCCMGTGREQVSSGWADLETNKTYLVPWHSISGFSSMLRLSYCWMLHFIDFCPHLLKQSHIPIYRMCQPTQK